MPKIPYPEHINIKTWFAELNRVYKKDRLPILFDENKWEETANYIAGTSSFRKKAVPSATSIRNGQKVKSFDDWKAWAKKVYITMIRG